MTTSTRIGLLLSGILGVNIGLLPATLYQLGVMPWLIGLGVAIVFVGLFFTANYSHLFSEIVAQRAKITLYALLALFGSTIGLVVGFFG
jgi:hypothetical protein